LSNKVEELKRISERHMQYQLEIAEKLPTLTLNEFTEFNNWHKNHPLHKEISEKFQLIDTK
jgi:hypothetical protein